MTRRDALSRLVTDRNRHDGSEGPVFGEQEIRKRNQAGWQPWVWEMRCVLAELDRVREQLRNEEPNE